MDWLTEPIEQATPQQRRAIYRFVLGVEGDRVRDLIRMMTKKDAAAVLDAFIAADQRSKATPQEAQQAVPQPSGRVGSVEPTQMSADAVKAAEAILIG